MNSATTTPGDDDAAFAAAESSWSSSSSSSPPGSITMTTTTSWTGLVAALVAPLLLVMGVMIWDHHWMGGSPFALNLYQSNLASIGFFLVVLLQQWTGTKTSSSTASSWTDSHDGSSEPDDDWMDSDSDPSSSHSSGAIIMGLLISSLLGILIGDWAWLEALRVLGTRKVIVVDCFKPFLAALLGQVVLHESLGEGKIWAFLGLALTAVGILLVAMEQEDVVAEEGEEVVVDKAEPTKQEEVDETTYSTHPEKKSNQDDDNDNENQQAFLSNPQLHPNHNKTYGSIPTQYNPTETTPLNLRRNQDDTLVLLDHNNNQQQSSPSLSSKRIVVQSSSSYAEKRKQHQRRKQQNQQQRLARSTIEQNEDETNVQQKEEEEGPEQLVYGLSVAILNVVLHSVGVLLTKQYGRSLTTWEINGIRFGFAGLVLLFISMCMYVWNYCQTGGCCCFRSTPYFNLSVSPHNETDAAASSKIRKKHNHHRKGTTTHISSSEEVAEGAVLVTHMLVGSHTLSPTYDMATTHMKHQETSDDDDNDNDETNEYQWYALPWSTMTQWDWYRVSIGVLFVTFLSPTLINYALFQIPFALSLTLESIGPLYNFGITIVAWLLALIQRNCIRTAGTVAKTTTSTQQERPRIPVTFSSSIGACCAVAGIALFAYHTKSEGKP